MEIPQAENKLRGDLGLVVVGCRLYFEKNGRCVIYPLNF
jgi:hypothetical protein